MRLSDVGTSSLTWRRLGVLLRQLPIGSRLARIQGGPRTQWTLTDHLLASLIDATNAGNWQRGGGKGARPRPVPRPEQERESIGTAVDLRDLRRILHPEQFEEVTHGS